MAEQYLEDAKRGLEYTSPSGRVYRPQFQKTSVHRQRNFKAFEFVDVEGAMIQDLGMSSDRFNLRMWFTGSNHHKQAQSFLSALSERGYAKLTLPLDDRDHRVVLPVDIKEENDLVDFINRTVFEVEFRETIGKYIDPENPEVAVAPESAASFSSKVGDLTEDSKEGFAEGLKTEGEEVVGISLLKSINAKLKTGLNFDGEWVNVLDTAKEQINDLRKIQSTLIKEFESVTASIDQLANDFLEAPLILASQIQSALNIPKFPLFENLIDSYGTFIRGLQDPPRSYGRNSNNYLHIQTIFGVSAISSLALKTTSSDFETRQSAIDALDEVKDIYENFVTYLEAQEEATSELKLVQRFSVAPNVYEALYAVVQGITGRIEQRAAGLRQVVEKTVTYPTTSLNIAAQYYPALFAADQDEALRRVEELSELQGSQIVLLERGDTFKVLI